MHTPNLFHVGHPRCATGLVYRWLSAHPDVFMARKELHGFGRDIGFNAPERTLDNYLSHFADAGDATRIGDSSTWYLASETAADEIAAFCPDARIVVNLRDPVDMLLSLHAHLLANHDEDVADPWAAWLASARPRLAPAGSLPRVALRYRDHVRYADQVGRYLGKFGPERVHVVFFDDLRDDPVGTYRSLCRFLDVRDDFPELEDVARGDARSRNSHWTVRSRRVQRLLKRPVNQAVYMGLQEGPFPGWFQVLRVLRRLNTVQVPRRTSDAAFRARVAAEVLPEIERLELLLGRDLSAWKRRAR